MSELRTRVGSFFLAPAAPRRAAPAAAADSADIDSVALLAAPSAAERVGAAVVLALSGGPALLALWGADRRPVAGAPVTPAARRLARSMEARGLAATAIGRLVTLELPAGEHEAVAALARVEAAAAGAPVLAVVAGARGSAWDAVLHSRDAVLVHGEDAELVALAVARLGSPGVEASALATPAPHALMLARVGLTAPGTTAPLRAAVPAISA